MDEAFEDEERRAERDRRVRDIEGGPMPSHGVEIEEVHHLPKAHPVDEIPQGAAEDAGEPGAKQALFAVPENHDGNDDGGNHGEEPEHRSLPAVGPGEEAE